MAAWQHAPLWVLVGQSLAEAQEPGLCEGQVPALHGVAACLAGHVGCRREAQHGRHAAGIPCAVYLTAASIYAARHWMDHVSPLAATAHFHSCRRMAAYAVCWQQAIFQGVQLQFQSPCRGWHALAAQPTERNQTPSSPWRTIHASCCKKLQSPLSRPAGWQQPAPQCQAG